jgi:uncharacterized protein (TIGR02246 family)
MNDIESLVRTLLGALRRQDAAGCAALYAEDGLIVSTYGPPARGSDEIRATHQSWFDEGETNKRLTLMEADAGDKLGYCVLAYAANYLRSDGTYVTDSGKSVNVLRRHTNGDWKIQVSSLTADKA